jgi:gamma-glutamyl phosphate reductase
VAWLQILSIKVVADVEEAIGHINKVSAASCVRIS